MDVVLVRHGNREGSDLTTRGQHQVERLARALRQRGVRPTLLLSSDAPYSMRTRDFLCEQLRDARTPIVDISAPLNPLRGNPSGLDAIVMAAEAKGIDLWAHSIVVLVGHERRLSNLLIELTSHRSRPLEHGGAVCVHGDSAQALLRGKGEVTFRYPVVDHHEGSLRLKVQSKMMVATFLAGFASLAFVETIIAPEFSTMRAVGSVLLTLALTLFVAAVYIYDELSMPEGFWMASPPGGLGKRLARRGERTRNERWRRIAEGEAQIWSIPAKDTAWLPNAVSRNRALADEDAAQFQVDGPLYTYMIRTWRWVFTPAVVLALVGFAILVIDRESLLLDFAFVAAVALGVAWLMWQRPPSAVD